MSCYFIDVLMVCSLVTDFSDPVHLEYSDILETYEKLISELSVLVCGRCKHDHNFVLFLRHTSSSVSGSCELYSFSE